MSGVSNCACAERVHRDTERQVRGEREGVSMDRAPLEAACACRIFCTHMPLWRVQFCERRLLREDRETVCVCELRSKNHLPLKTMLLGGSDVRAMNCPPCMHPTTQTCLIISRLCFFDTTVFDLQIAMVCKPRPFSFVPRPNAAPRALSAPGESTRRSNTPACSARLSRLWAACRVRLL